MKDKKVLQKALMKLRRAINKIDHSILNLVKQRLNIGKSIAKVKIKMLKRIRDKKREKEVVSNAIALAKKKGIIKTKADEKMIKALFNWMIKRNVEEQKHIFYSKR